ncbi:MAG: lysylphosphatidylglycerol synthase transmembrane domain-containing protein [Candidatus Desantisbacteria bacterium]
MNKLKWLGLFISTVLIGLIIQKIDIAAFWKGLIGLNYPVLIAGVLVYLAGYGVRAVRWYYLLSHAKKIRFSSLFSIMIIGFMANNILPARAGEFVRAYMLGIKESQSKSLALATVVMERILDGLVFVLLLIIIWLFFPLPEWIKKTGIFATIIFGCAILFMFWLHSYKFHALELFRKAFFWLPHKLLDKIIYLLKYFIEGLQVLQSKSDFLRVCLLSLITWGIELGMYYLTILSFGINLPFYGIVLLMVMVNLCIMIPSAPAYIGVFQAAVLGVLYKCFGLEYNLSLSVSVVLHGIIVIPVTVLGFIFMARENMSISGIIKEQGCRVSK